MKSYSRNVAEGARQSISDPEGATECPFCCILQEGSPHPPRLMHYETIDGPRGNVVLRLKLGMGAQFHVCWANKAGELGYVESGSYAESEIDMSGLDVSLANCYFAHHS